MDVQKNNKTTNGKKLFIDITKYFRIAKIMQIKRNAKQNMCFLFLLFLRHNI